jgi:Domain of unknown function (DUF4386)
MSTTVVMDRMAVASPCLRARVAGVFEALEGLTSAYGQLVLGFRSSLVGVACHVVWVLLFYELFKPVNRSLSLLAAFAGLVVCALEALAAFLYLAPFLVLTGGNSVSTFTMEQLQALAVIFLRLNAYAFNVDLVFFGLWCILTGYLISRSRFLPRILGVLLAIDGLRLGDVCLPAACVPSVPFHRWGFGSGGNSAAVMAPRDGSLTVNDGMSRLALWRKAAHTAKHAGFLFPRMEVRT